MNFPILRCISLHVATVFRDLFEELLLKLGWADYGVFEAHVSCRVATWFDTPWGSGVGAPDGAPW